MKRRIIVGITGASGTIYGIKLLQILSRDSEIETHLVMSRAAEKTMSLEMKDWTVSQVQQLAKVFHDPSDLAAVISSGSFPVEAMVILPCSMKTLACVAHGMGDDLLTRSADVTLKERRPLIIVPRETPWHLGHLRNMVSITEMGGIIVPPIPAFYHQPQTIDDLILHTLGKILDLLKVEHQLFKRWS